MSDWLTTFYAQEEERFRKWVSQAVKELTSYGVKSITYMIVAAPGAGPVGIVAHIKGMLCGTILVERWIDAALAYSFGNNWAGFCYWFCNYQKCKPVTKDRETADTLELERRLPGSRYVDLLAANAVARALKRLFT